MHVRVEGKGKRQKSIRMPPLIVTSNAFPSVTLHEERMLSFFINERLSNPQPTHFRGRSIAGSDLEELRGWDLQAFFIIGIIVYASYILFPNLDTSTLRSFWDLPTLTALYNEFAFPWSNRTQK